MESKKQQEATMRKGSLAYLALALLFAARAEAQDVPASIQQAPAPTVVKQLPLGNNPAPSDPAGNFAPCSESRPACVDDYGQPIRVWGSVDYLMWWVKPGPLSTPLVTTGSTDDAVPGALGQPHTSVLFGGSNLDYGTTSGLRFAAGLWLPECSTNGIEASYFVFEMRAAHFGAASDPGGNFLIARPVISASDGTEFAYVVTSPGISTGGVSVSSTTWMQSFDINLAGDLIHESNVDLQLLAGFRLVNLEEDLRIGESIIPLQPGVFQFQAGPADPPSSLDILDHFRTVNRFYGGQLGGRLNWCLDKLNVAVTGKLALGVTQEVITVDGSTSLLTPGAPTVTVPGGILAQPTNIGRTVRNEFSVVPEVGINLGYQITPNLKAVVGYNFLYWSNVARPGDQIDRTVNFTQVPIDPTFGPLNGAARPALTPHSTDFWAQGINLGLQLQF
jgi:hypothetical protein